jgi:xanthine dehydrogenase YagS FAD-binding subunit
VIPIAQFYLLPGDTPERETVLEPGDLVTHVTIPALPFGVNSLYLKLRDRASFEFALVSAAVIVKQNGGRIDFIRIAMGGVGTAPWRCHEAEKALHGKPATPTNFRKAAEVTLRNAKPQSQNVFKVELAKRCLTHALTQATIQG